MRYSKKKVIASTVIAVLCFSAIVFLIIKGISDSKKLTEADVQGRLTASVSNKKEEDKKEKSKKTSKNESKKTETESDDNEAHVVEVKEKKTVDNSITGTYVVTELKIGDKEYTKEELENLKNEGRSLSLRINKNGLASVSVLDLDRSYEITDTYFSDGSNKIEYAKNIGKIRIKIDDYQILFEKE